MRVPLALLLITLAAPSPVPAAEVDAGLTVSAFVLGGCAVAARIEGAAVPAVRLSLDCLRTTSGCAVGFGPLDAEPLPAAALDRCRLDARMAPPVAGRTPALFQVDF
ncbi:MAG TPA: hypothetical protein VD995_32095 [Azospirillum sp.]|nr:hypothetical protein [Azospirillum sp.]